MPTSVLESTLFKDMFGTPEMRAVFDDQATLARYVEVEVALARVQGDLGVIPKKAAQAIAQRADASKLDMAEMKREPKSLVTPSCLWSIKSLPCVVMRVVICIGVRLRKTSWTWPLSCRSVRPLTSLNEI